MTETSSNSRGFLTLTLHAHLPYVVNHGTWPHGIEWLLEAAAETYLPLLRALERMANDGIALHCNLNLTPILLEQLAHPVFRAEFPNYLERKIAAAREDEAFFVSTGEQAYAETARFWQGFFSDALQQFHELNQDITGGFRSLAERGLIDILTCGATHGYMPLLGTDESVRAQVRTAMAVHERHIGRKPRGIWAPECGYRPAGQWSFPVAPEARPTPEACERAGIEEVLSESGLEFFFVDTHLVQESARVHSPYEFLHGARNVQRPGFDAGADPAVERRIYHPFYVEGPYQKDRAVTVFARDPRTGLQVWSGDSGYPGDESYLDFHKKRWPGGHRYWRVTGPRVDIADKQPYVPAAAAERVRSHAEHFVHMVWEAIQTSSHDDPPPIVCAPFDAELFGHWWFEGIQWLETVARILHDYQTGITLTTCANYLDHCPRGGFLTLHEGSWGAEGNNQVWLNPETSWTYERLYAAELACRDICSSAAWKDGGLGERIVKQLCRELLLLESSDWQFLITTGAARDYAENRFHTHLDQFRELQGMWSALESKRELSHEQMQRLGAIEDRDNIFPEIDPAFWAAGAKADPPAAVTFRSQSVSTNGSAATVNIAETRDASRSEIPKFLVPLANGPSGEADEPL